MSWKSEKRDKVNWLVQHNKNPNKQWKKNEEVFGWGSKISVKEGKESDKIFVKRFKQRLFEIDQIKNIVNLPIKLVSNP